MLDFFYQFLKWMFWYRKSKFVVENLYFDPWMDTLRVRTVNMATNIDSSRGFFPFPSSTTGLSLFTKVSSA